jgi:serine/threonine protein kinase
LERADQLVIDLASTLKVVHDQGLIHRDVSPDNIFLTKNGDMKLIDFGAARSYLESRSRDLSTLVKPGFSALEQYSTKGVQGTWTDVYSLAATYYYVIAKRKVPEVMDRVSGEEIIPLHHFDERLGPEVSSFLEDCLMLDYKSRVQDMPEFIRRFTEVRGKKEHEIRLTAILGENQISTWKLLPDEEVVIGRSQDECQVVIADTKISRRHCSIRYDSKRKKFVLNDFSSNGTCVMNKKIGRGNRMYLDSGDIFSALSEKYRFLIEIR